MRIGMLAAALVCAGTMQANAAAITVRSPVIFAVASYGGIDLPIMPPLAPAPFDTRLGTLTDSFIDFTGSIDPGVISFSKYALDVLPMSLILAPMVDLFVPGFGFTSTSLPTQIVPVTATSASTGYVMGASVRFSIHSPSPIDASFVADPTYNVGAFTKVTIPANDPGYIVRTEGADSSRLTGVLSLTYVYTPIPEPISLALLGVGLGVLALARTRKA